MADQAGYLEPNSINNYLAEQKSLLGRYQEKTQMHLFGKITRQFFDSSVNELDVLTRFVFMSMIALADQHGNVDMTYEALSRRLNITIEQLTASIAELMEPDPESRTKEHEGRRLIPIDPQRSWGWIVVNKTRYLYPSDDERRESDKERKKTGRKQAAPNSELTESDFERLWKKYPKKKGKPEALAAFFDSVETRDDLLAIERLVESAGSSNGTAPQGKTFFKNWRSYQPVASRKEVAL